MGGDVLARGCTHGSGRWCSRCWDAARSCVDRQKYPAGRWRRSARRGGPSCLIPSPPSTSGGVVLDQDLGQVVAGLAMMHDHGVPGHPLDHGGCSAGAVRRWSVASQCPVPSARRCRCFVLPGGDGTRPHDRGPAPLDERGFRWVRLERRRPRGGPARRAGHGVNELVDRLVRSQQATAGRGTLHDSTVASPASSFNRPAI